MMGDQPGLLVLLAEGRDDLASADLLRGGHLALDARALGAALAQGGAASIVAHRLAAQCDAVVGRPAPPLATVLQALRRPAYASASLVPPARSAAVDRVPPWCDLRLLLAASRALDR
jgi:hypothetical protein